jgi:hypothetical protein
MNALKIEHENFENTLKTLKQQLPKLDESRLLQDYRKDVINRRIKDGASFVNPLEVKESDFATRLLDPENISDYITDISDLEKQVVQPKSVKEMNLAVGSSRDFVPFEGKIPFFAEAVLPEGYKEGDYLPKGFVPGTRVKSETVPEIKQLTGQDFRVVPDEVYNNFADDVNGKILVTSLAKQKFPDYKNFTPVEKFNAQKNALYDYINQKNVSGFTSKERKVKADTNINMPKEDTPTVNVYPEIEKLVDSRKEGMAAPLNQLSSTTQGIILDFARKAKGDNQLSQSEIAIMRNKNGQISIYDFDTETSKVGTMIAPVSKLDVNLEAQPTAKGKTEILKAQPVESGKITVILNGQEGDIPASNWEAFKKKYPNAKRK